MKTKMTTLLVRNSRRGFLLIALLLACFGLSPASKAVVPPPDGGYPNFTTAEGTDALKNLTTGVGNTATGWHSLFANTAGNLNTATGAGTLLFNTGDNNTATGALALLLNTTGTENTATGTDALVHNDIGSENTAIGAFALYSNNADSNTAIGDSALFSNTAGSDNTAIGFQALYSNTSGGGNNAFGYQALLSNISGIRNLAVGSGALSFLTSGDSNVAVGNVALAQGVTVNFNTALGRRALFRSPGDQNVGLGFWAGGNLSDGGTNNIYVGNVGPVPIGSESNTIRIGMQTATTVTAANPPETHEIPAHTATFIAGISGTAVVGDTVVVDANGQLGTVASSVRFKKEIKPMDDASEAILALKPVSFRYKSDSKGTPQFGLIAEEVANVNPDLIVRDRKGEIYSVRYEAVNAMLLNEFLKEHRAFIEEQRKVQKLEATVAQQHKDFDAALADLKGQIQKVSAQLELSKPATQTVLNNQ